MDNKKDSGIRDISTMSITDNVVKFSTNVHSLFSREGLSYVKKETLEFKNLGEASIYYSSVSAELNSAEPGTIEHFTKALSDSLKPKESLDDASFDEWRDKHFYKLLWKGVFGHRGSIKGNFTLDQLKGLYQADPKMEAVREYVDHHPETDFAKVLEEIEEGMKPRNRHVGNYPEALEPKPFPISEEDFFNKKYCDTIREMVVKSTICVDEAIMILKGSKDLSRDAHISMKLRDAGISKSQVLHTIRILNS